MADNKASSKPELSISDRYRRLVYIVDFCAKICGANVTDADFKINWTSFAAFITIINFYFCTFYTIYMGIEDVSVILQTCCFLGPGFQGSVKFFCYLANVEKMQGLQRFLDNTFMTYETKGDTYRDVLSKGLEKIRRCFKVFLIINICVIIGCSTIPVFYYAFTKEKILIMQFLLPGLNPNTKTGYILYIIVHFTTITIGVSGTFAGDMYLLIFLGNIPLLKDLLRCKIDELNNILDREVKPTMAELHSSIVEVVAMHHDYLRLIDHANSMFFLIIFACVSSAAMGIITTLYCTLAGVWPGAPFLLVISFLSLYAYCGLGTVVDNSNEDCSDLIYRHCRWYDLPVREQRCILLMLRVSQTTPSLSIGYMMPLNVATGLQLTKAISSMVMLLLRKKVDDAK